MRVTGHRAADKHKGAAASDRVVFSAQGIDTVSRNNYVAPLKRNIGEYDAESPAKGTFYE